jgi:hypothetical protein
MSKIHKKRLYVAYVDSSIDVGEKTERGTGDNMMWRRRV